MDLLALEKSLETQITDLFYKTARERGTDDIVIVGASHHGVLNLKAFVRTEMLEKISRTAPPGADHSWYQELKRRASEVENSPTGCAVWVLLDKTPPGSLDTSVQVSILILPPVAIGDA